LKIKTQVTAAGVLIVSEDEKILCSSYDPLKEASDWAQRIETQNLKSAAILGLGAGHHVEELFKRVPGLRLTVIDFRPQLFEIFETHKTIVADSVQSFCLGIGARLDDRIFNFFEDVQPTILCFRPAWKNHERLFSDLFASLTFRNLQMIQRSLQKEMQAGVFDFSKMKDQDHLIHLKNLHESLKDFGDETALKISILRELWI